MKTFKEWSSEDSSVYQKVMQSLPKGIHYINKCSCGTIISQCRCGSPERITIIYPKQCEECQK